MKHILFISFLLLMASGCYGEKHATLSAPRGHYDSVDLGSASDKLEIEAKLSLTSFDRSEDQIPIFELSREVRPVRQAEDQWNRLHIIFTGQLKQASRELKERHSLSEAWLAQDQQGTTDVLETESVMNVKVIKLLYMIHIDADAYDTKTFNYVIWNQ